MAAAFERRWVDELAKTLFAPLLLGRSKPSGWRVLSWDAEQGLCLTLARGARCISIEIERRNPELACFDRTERFNVCARRSFDASSALDEPERRIVTAVVRLIRRRERLLPSVERSGATRLAVVRKISVQRVLMPEGPGHYYLNPYVGCTIGCEFCYAAERADFSRELEGLPRLAWGRWVDVKDDAPELLRRELKEQVPGIVRLSPIITDPYQPIERRFRVTRRCLEALLEAGYTPCILTRAARVLEDLPLLRRFERAAVGFSIPTADDAVRRAFEPGADPIAERLDALARCHAAGLSTFAVVQPALPGDPEELAARVAPIVRAVRVDRMHLAERADGLWAAFGVGAGERQQTIERTEQAVSAAFAARGVPRLDLDDLSSLFDESPQT
jgi:DNA repair photolyase